MKRFISLALSALTVASLLASCTPAKEQLDPSITLASSDAASQAQWLDTRLDTIPDDVVLGIGTNEAYGVDMTNFDDKGYIARVIGGDVLLFGKTSAGLDRAVREYAKAADTGATANINTVYGQGAWIEKLTIDGKDISEFTVVYNHDRDMKPISSYYARTVGNAEYASGELVRLIQKATGVTLQAVPHTEMPDGPIIMIDYITDGSCGENGFSYKIENGNLYINGAPDANGCANGVYYFLEYECGWDNLMFGDSIIQESDHVALENGVTKTVKPIFDYIVNSIGMYIPSLRFTNDRSAASQNYSGVVLHACHGMAGNEWSGLSTYQVNMISQICHTDENVYANVFDKIMTHVKSRQNAGQVIGEEITSIDISQGDNMRYCQCSSCLKIYREEGKAHAGAVLRFANRLAEEMEAEGFGGIVYQIFAYHGSNNPPSKTVARDDIFVTFVTDGACANHPLAGGECFGMSFDMAGMVNGMEYLNNNDYAAWIAGWGQICKNVYVWHYGMPHNFGTYSYYQNLYGDLMFLKESGIRGIQWEGEYNGLGFSRLRIQLVRYLIFNPDVTEEEYNIARDKIMELEYGEGYEYIQDYIDILETTEAGGDRCWNCWGYGDLFNADSWDVEMFYNRSDECLQLLELALSKTSTPLQDQLIKSLITEVLYRQCAIGYFEAYDADDTAAIAALEEKYQLCLKTGTEAGFGTLWPMGFKGYALVVQPTIEEAAWITWNEYREELTFGDREMREMPQKWSDWYETSVAETST